MTIFVLVKTNLNVNDMEQQNQPQPPVFNPQQQQAPQYQPRVTARPVMSFPESVKTCLGKFFDFKGRARRSELWWFVLFAFVCWMVASSLTALVLQILDVDSKVAITVSLVVSTIVSLFFLFPLFSALTRRLHDTGRSGWWIAIFALMGVLYYVCYAIVMWPIRDQIDANSDPFAMAQVLTEAMASTPIAATIMSVCSFPTLILAVVILVFSLFDSKWEANKYGPSPKYQ